jgi:FkbM family methyltransferase
VRSVLRSVIKWTLFAVIAGGLTAIAFEVAVWIHPPVVALGLAAAGYSPRCGAVEAYHGFEIRSRQHEATARLRLERKLVKSDTAGYRLWKTGTTAFWVPAGSDDVLPILVAQQEAEVYGEGALGIRRGDVVLDCGAHVGVYTRKALAAGAALVVAIEPAPANIECLRRNLDSEIKAGRVIVCPKGVWDSEDVLPLYEDPVNSAADSFVIRGSESQAAHRIALTTIDNLVELELKLKRVDVVKLDIKGATERALNGAKKTLQRDRPRLAISTEESADDPDRLRRVVLSIDPGYRAVCGSCSVDENLMISPDVLLFRQMGRAN